MSKERGYLKKVNSAQIIFDYLTDLTETKNFFEIIKKIKPDEKIH